jgi:hypothetical protein
MIQHQFQLLHLVEQLQGSDPVDDEPTSACDGFLLAGIKKDRVLDLPFQLCSRQHVFPYVLEALCAGVVETSSLEA